MTEPQPPDEGRGAEASYFSGAASADVLAADGSGGGSGRKLRWIGAAGAGALVLALVGGVTYGFSALGGGGTYADAVLPTGAFAYAELDLDPSAGQKVDAFRFMRQFPDLRDRLADEDLKRSIFESMVEDVGWEEIDYAADVEPWLGDRLAFAAYPAGQFGPARGDDPAPTAVVALQVSDEGAARDGLARLDRAADGADRSGFVVTDGYAFIAETQEIAEKVRSAAAETPLADDADFAADMSAMDDGIARVWFDIAAATEAAAGFGSPLGLGGVTTTTGASGRATFVARFDGPDAFELAGRVVGAEQIDGVAPAALQGMADLPAGSVAALGLAGGEDLVDPMWESLREQLGPEALDSMVTEAEREFGVSLPADLETLLGTNLLVALDRDGFDAGDPSVGARVTTDPAAAQDLIDRLEPMLQSVLPTAAVKTTDDGYVVASNAVTYDRLTDLGSGDTLGSNEYFRKALPDVADARLGIWLDLAGLTRAWGVEDENIDPIAGVGLTASYAGDNGEFRFRLVTT